MTEQAAPDQATATVGTMIAGAVATAFGAKAEPFLHGELKRESMEAVDKLRQRFTQRIKETVDAALRGSTDEDLKKACTEYCIALARTRKECTPKQLAEKAAQGAEALRTETKEALSELTALEEALQRRISGKKGPDDYWYDEGYKKVSGDFHPFRKLMRGVAWFFGMAAREEERPAQAEAATAEKPAAEEAKSLEAAAPPAAPANDDSASPVPEQDTPDLKDKSKTRIYFRLNDYSKSPVEPFVKEYVEKQGYSMSDQDYIDGYAWDKRKNKVKLGKILKDEAGLYEAFREDFFRMGKNLLVVITRDYEDLARASYARGWQSCRAGTSSAISNGVNEINIGVMSAYLIREDDPDINNPLGRVNLKPYDSIVTKRTSWGDEEEADTSSKKKTVYLTFNPIGLHHPGFVDAVNRFADENLNGDKYGRFKLRNGCESYREFQQRTRLPMDAEGALKAVGAKYSKDDSGRITVKGDISFSGLGLNRLPDLTDVTVEGGIDVSNNKLLTLEGLPKAPLKWLNASSNLLVCFTGCTPEVKETFSYRDNCYLMTTYGAPKAASYQYGNGHQSHARYGEGEKCIGPCEEPERFPSFKRKN